MDGLGSADILLFEGFRLDRRGGVLYRSAQGAAGVPVELGPRTIALLGLLAARQGDVVSKDAIMKAVWPGRAVEDANLNMQISKLRQMLDQNRGEGSCIQTFRGRGYCFVAPVTRLGADAPPALPTISEVDVRPRQRLSIVVLPFDNLSRDPGQQYFADGITEDLTTTLSRFTDMLVISRNTAFTYRDRPRETRQIGRELGVCYLLEGSVRRSSRRVRVNAQLIDAEADAHLWAERFDRHLSDLFKLQDEITNAIATPSPIRARQSVGVARCQGEIQRGWSWCARRMSADDPSTRFMSMSRKTNKYSHSWCAVLSPSATRATKPEALRAIPL